MPGGQLLMEQDAAIRFLSLDTGAKIGMASEKESTSLQPYGCSDGHIVFARGKLRRLFPEHMAERCRWHRPAPTHRRSN